MDTAQHTSDPLLGQIIVDRYELLERIGEGGMGVVYKARQVPIDRIVAIKMLNQQMVQDPNWVQRFFREAKACSQLQHPNTIRMFDTGQTREGRPFMSMEFLDGRSLREAIAEDSPMHPVRVLKILIQCCASLAEAHAAGIIHRDIKPDNVFLLSMAGSPDFVKLLDFSVAKLLQESDGMRTQAGIVFGTPQYMSPEQGRGLPLDARSDLYALGILAYEMLTGTVPFHHDNPMAVLQMHVKQPVPVLPAEVPRPVQEVVARALAKEPGKRYASAGEMMHHCQQAAAMLGNPAAVPQPAPPSPQAEFGPDQQTVIAGQNPGFRAPNPPAPAPAAAAAPPANLHGNAFASADHEAKTVIAGQRPPLPTNLPPHGANSGHNPGSPDLMADAKTIIGGFPGSPVPPPGHAGAPPMPVGHIPHQGGPPHQGGFPHQGGPPHQGGFPPQDGPAPVPNPQPIAGGDEVGPPKTILLQNSEGVVSFSQTGPIAHDMPVAPNGPALVATGPQHNASLVFWVICVASGLTVGVLAYLIVLAIA